MAKGETRKAKVKATLLRALLKNNVELLAARKLPPDNVPLEISKASKRASRVNPVSRSQAQRIFKLTFGGSLEQLQALADALGVLPYELLDPDLEAHFVREAANAKDKASVEQDRQPTPGTKRSRRNASPAVP